MTYRMHGVLVASLGAVALLFSANETFAAQQGVRGAFASTRPMPHARGVHAFRHNRRNQGAIFWPGYDDFSDGSFGPSGGEPALGAPQPSGDVRYNYTYDVPWDWAHRFPPNVTPSDKPYVSSCPVETVTLTGRDGADKTINVIRCY
jgi:hypothetical protein